MTQTILSPDALWPAICARSRQALADGALQTIQTHTEIIEDHGVSFRISIADSLVRKDTQAPRANDPAVNPLLPPEAALLVGPLSPTHLVVLNKFNVTEHHVLLVTREFEHQETLITRADFNAVRLCLAGYEGLAFHNGGRIAGASQMHKHLQVVPLPLGDADPPVPIESLLTAGTTKGRRLPQLPFEHAFALLPLGADENVLFEHYKELLAEIGITEMEVDGERRQSAPYNLLLTRRWMLLVPRTRGRFEGVSLNALAFAGSLFVRSEEQLRLLKDSGPMAALRAVTSL